MRFSACQKLFSFPVQWWAVCWIGTFLAGAFFSTPASADGSISLDDQITHWIDELDNDQYRVREQATNKLRAIGSSARPQLRDVADSPNLELRTRARRLLILIEDGDFQRRLDEFAADTDGTHGITLPGWEPYRQAIGSDAASRALFVEMQRHQADLFVMAFGDKTLKKSSDEKIEGQLNLRLARLLSLRPQPHTSRGVRHVPLPALASCAAVMFIGTEFGDRSWSNVSIRLAHLNQKPPLSAAVVTGAYRSEIRKLMANWIVKGHEANHQAVERKLQLIAAHQLEKALPFALEVALGQGEHPQFQAKLRGMAALIIGKLGDEQMVAKLHPLLTAQDACVHIGVRNIQGKAIPSSIVQLRDVVLAVLLEQHGQDLAEYGLLRARHSSGFLFDLYTLGFENDEQRAKAFAKWDSQVAPD